MKQGLALNYQGSALSKSCSNYGMRVAKITEVNSENVPVR